MWRNTDNIVSLWKIQNVIWITECIELGDDCTLNCVDGYETDANGCDICECVDVCEVKKCQACDHYKLNPKVSMHLKTVQV